MAAGLLGAVALSVAAACGDDDSDDGAGAVRVTMSDELRFEPDELRVKAGEPVVLVLDNSDGSTLHDFTVDEMPVMDVDESMGAEHEMGESMAALHMAMDAGDSGEMRFTPMEPGEYEFYCSVTGHAQAGMRGKLIVE
ncbi:MAG: cupredoxin domain-containing protein [Dehalococcoidia bacterium]|nr:cupredoxin domain-containing protein [Dehalococcoidia bacterium]